MTRTRFPALLLWLALWTGSATAAAQLGARSAEEWARTLDSPQRIASLKIEETVSKLRLKPGDVVADIGAGTGVFEGALAAAVGPGGTVYAVDIDQGLLDHIARRAADLRVENVKVVLGAFADPGIPARNVDLAFINDVLHHIRDRAGYLKALAAYVGQDGRIAIVDYYPERGGHRNQPELQVTMAQTAGWMAAAGFKPAEEIPLFTDKWFVIYSR